MKPINAKVWTVLAVIVLVSTGSLVAHAQPIELTPENTVILSNETDASFCRDFSVLLKNLRVEWVILDTAEVPESVRDKNLIIVGRPDAEYTGDIITELVTQEEADYVRQDGHYSVLEKDSPWNDSRIIHISAASDLLLTKRATEEAITSIMENGQARGEWYLSALSGSREEAEAYITEFQYVPDDNELPKETLSMDVGAKPPRSISAEEATEDTEYLFYLLSHGWCGYGYFSTQGDLEAAKESMLEKLDERSKWSPDDLSQLIYEHLSFIHDCHLNVGNRQYCSHLDFWYETRLELWTARGEYYFFSDNAEYKVVSVNGERPEQYMFPSLNAQGDPIYRLGMLSYVAPEPLMLIAQDGQEVNQFEIELHRSDFRLYRDSKEKFGEERIGGIPVLRARSFGDYYSDELNRFLQAADRYKGEPYLIIDIRGNSGGNTRWPKQWIARFTGHSPSLKLILTELTSRTTMMGRVNLFKEMLATYPEKDAAWIQREIDSYNAQADAFEQPSQAPYWSLPIFPSTQFIPNDTTLIVIADQQVPFCGHVSPRSVRMELVYVSTDVSGGQIKGK